MKGFCKKKGWAEVLCLCVALLAVKVAAEEGEYLQLRGAVHVHSTFSTGEESIEQIAGRAVAHGLDVLVVSDDDLLQVEYGIPFLRRLWPFSEERNSLMGTGSLGTYLEEIRRVDALFPELVVIDGVESAPFYYWQVDLAQRRLTLRHWNKHLMAVGFESESAYARLPVSGNDALYVWHGSSILLMWPLIGLAYGWVARRHHPAGLRYGVMVVSGVCLLNNYPFKVELWDGYSGDLGAAPYQYYIDYVVDNGGMVFWTHPESKSTLQPMQVLNGLVEIVSDTPAHAGDLVDTRGYTGFAALYGDNITAIEPGREWDRILGEYLQGRRERPVWGTADIDYHYDDVKGNNQLHDVQTVFWALERSRSGVLEAMREGRMYATRGGDELMLLDEFRVDTGIDQAISGEEVLSRGTARIHVRFAKIDGAEEPMQIQLIKAGEVVAEVKGKTPLEFKHIDTGIAPGEKTFYRLLARSRTARLASNPIFVSGAEP